MNKETLIDIFLAFLAPVINPEHEEIEKPAPQVAFLSSTEVQLCEAAGQMLPTNKVFECNKLVQVLYRLYSYDYEAEEAHYAMCLYEDLGDEEGEAFEERNEYDPKLLSDHIYHSLRYIKELVESYKEITGDSSFETQIPWTMHD